MVFFKTGKGCFPQLAFASGHPTGDSELSPTESHCSGLSHSVLVHRPYLRCLRASGLRKPAQLPAQKLHVGEPAMAHAQ